MAILEEGTTNFPIEITKKHDKYSRSAKQACSRRPHEAKPLLYYIFKKNHRQIDVEKSFGIKKRPVFNEILGKSIKYHSNLQFRQYILTSMAKFILSES